jgi:alanyl-tRNA synthetase
LLGINKMKSSNQLRETFLEFYKSRGYAQVANVSLVPNVDSTLLFVNSGMFPLAPYLGGQPHPMGDKLCNVQRCLRTKYDEMLEIGDNRHTLMFEMLGHWSLGQLDKQQQIEWCLQLHVEGYGLDPHRLYVSVWGGDETVPRDEEAIAAWKEAFSNYGIDAEFSEDLSAIPADVGSSESHTTRIFPYGKSDNWWQRGEAPGELGGPSSEIFFDLGTIEREENEYHINDDSGRFIEIGNNVFMEYKLDEDMNWQALPAPNLDFGGGFERIVMCAQGKSDIFETDIYQPILDKVAEISGKAYKQSDGSENEWTRSFRVIADHGRAATFILADGVIPSNKDQGSVLRRFIRRLVRFGLNLGIEKDFTEMIAKAVIEHMSETYPHLQENQQQIVKEICKEERKFRKTLRNGLKELEKLDKSNIDGDTAFYLYETFGFPLELTLAELEVDEDEAEEISKQFYEAEAKHREKSRMGAEKKFKGGLADNSEETIALHTAHHLLLRALQMVLGDHVKQKGSNITAERLRIDVSHPEKITPEQIAEIEETVNKQLKESQKVLRVEMPKEVAESIGAEMEFGQKYGETVSVYMIGDFSEQFEKAVEDKDFEKMQTLMPAENILSKEFCGGPHVQSTSEIAEHGQFKIVKEKSSGSGVRRIKAQLV